MSCVGVRLRSRSRWLSGRCGFGPQLMVVFDAVLAQNFICFLNFLELFLRPQYLRKRSISQLVRVVLFGKPSVSSPDLICGRSRRNAQRLIMGHSFNLKVRHTSRESCRPMLTK
jgi:hypothetical protein